MPETLLVCLIAMQSTGIADTRRHQGTRLAAEMRVGCSHDEAPECSFNTVTEAHINLFFYMLTLNLAIHNKVNNVQK